MNENLKHILRLDIKHPIDYWHKYWNYAVGELEKADSLKILLRTPRIVLTDLLEEVSNDGIWIKENIELFQKELSNWKKDDKAFNIVFGKDLSQLLRNLKFKDKKPLLKQQCMVMLQKMDKGQYFDNLVTQIETIVEADSQITYELKDEINKLTISMITELLSKGYPVEDLKGMSDGVPEVIFAEGHIVMGAPTVCCDLKRDDYTNEESYYSALTDKIKGRSPKEVVEGLKEYYYHKPFERIVLFRIEGLKGKVDIQIGDINFYCPCRKKYLKEEHPLNNIENCTKELVNAAVPVKCISLNGTVEVAKEKLEHALQLITLLELPNYPITISDRGTTTIKANGEVSGRVYMELDNDENERAAMKERSRYIESEDMSKLTRVEEVVKKLSLLENKPNQTSRILLSSMHWLDKCEHTEIPENRFLFAWIALENLIDLKADTLTCLIEKEKPSTREVVQIITSNIMCIQEYYSRRTSVFENLYYSIHTYDNYYEIPDKLANESELNKKPGERYNLNTFTEHLAELEDNVNDEIMRSEIHEVATYYKDVPMGVKDRTKFYENLTTILYRIRNMEVHHASHSNLIRYYVPFMVWISKEIFYVVLDEYSHTGDTIDNIFIRFKMEYDKLLIKNS